MFLSSRYFKIKYKSRCEDYAFCDCFGLVKLLYKDLYNINLPDYLSQYKKIENGHEDLVDKGEWIKTDKIEQIPSITLMSLYNNDVTDHIGFNINKFSFIHIVREVGSPIVSRIYDAKYKNKIRGFYKYVL